MIEPRPTVPLEKVRPSQRLEALWRQGLRPDVHQFVADAGIEAADDLAAVLAVDQWQRWHADERVFAEAYLKRYPALAENADAALDLIFGEVLVREERGETPTVAEYLGRFPRWAPQLQKQFDVHQALEPSPSFRLAATRISLAEPPPADGAPDRPAHTGRGLPVVAGYDVLGELGRGAMGVVYKARQWKLNRVVALKMVLAGSRSGPAERVRFLREAELAARMVHPNVVQVYEIGAHEGLPYFTQEYLEGGSLAARQAGKPLAPVEAAALVEQLARACNTAHERGVVHRDLKPGNVLLSASGAPKVADFGLARWTDLDPGLTKSGAVVGTASYMAPEQAAGKSQEVGPAADTYALGAILYELLTGRPPFLGQTAHDTLSQVLTLDPLPPRRLQPKTPRDLETICLKCLRKAPRQRYPSAGALADDLRRYLNGEPVLARPTGGAERLWRWCRRNPVPASLLLTVTLGSAFGMWHLSRLSETLVRSTALESAAQESEMFDELNNFYSAEVVERVKPFGVESTHSYVTTPGAIPAPATLTIDLGNYISAKSKHGSRVRLYSDVPFPFRKDGGAHDDFEREALASLRKNPQEPYYRFEEVQDRVVLRYATARVMKETCVHCHNTLGESPKKDWKVGDVRGVLEITRPLDKDEERTRGTVGDLHPTAVHTFGFLITS